MVASVLASSSPRTPRDSGLDFGTTRREVWQFLAAYEDQPDNWACSQIVKLLVQKKRRRQDIGGLLLREFERDAQDAERCLVVMSPDENAEKERLLSFYREHGYEFTDPAATIRRGRRGS